MKCSICGHEKFFTLHSYDTPDKYEKWVGIEDVNRSWVRCMKCGFYMQIRNYDLSQLEVIYKDGYRDERFRGESISEAFERIVAAKDSENEARYLWFALNIKYLHSKKILDVGSGIGVWPNIIKHADYDVTCVEENQISINFIQNQLGITCIHGIDSVQEQYDTLTLIHVLEHIEQPVDFLKRIKPIIRDGGQLFIEVPDSIEFHYLDADHDEFNSCHVAFYNMGSLYRVVEAAGFSVADMHLESTKQRNLSRVMCIAIN